MVKKTWVLRLLVLAGLSGLAPMRILAAAPPEGPVRVAIVGLAHDHVRGFMGQLAKHPETQVVAIVEPDGALAAAFVAKYHLDPKLVYADLDKALDAQHPEAVLVYTTVRDHRRVIEVAARHGVASMVEKPLATTLDDALAIRAAAREHHVPVLVNYETTWYASNAEALRQVSAGKLGTVRKVVVHDGHEGPREIGVSPEFFAWLTDPKENGAGAMFDFGCYGVDLMTVMMKGKAPLSVTAVAQTDKPATYPKVEDDATVVLRYPGAQAVLMPSWDWSFSRKDMEVYGVEGYAITQATDHLRVRYKGETAEAVVAAPPLGQGRTGSLDYLTAVLRGRIVPDGDLSALDTNVVVMQILDAARESARRGKTVVLGELPR